MSVVEEIREYFRSLRGDRRRLFWFCSLILYAAFICISFQFVHLITGDDMVYQRTVHGGLFHYLTWRYMVWTGRMTAEALIYIFLHLGLWTYHLLMPLTALALAWVFMRYRSTRLQVRALLFALLIPGLFNPFVLSWATYWFTGSFNYEIPVTLCLLGVIPLADAFYRGESRMGNVLFAACLLAGFLGTLGNEQAALVVSALSVLLIVHRLIRREKTSPKHYFLAAALIAGTAVNIFSPGMKKRWYIEQRWFPGFNQLTLMQHLKFGTYWFFDSVVNVQGVLIIALSLVPLLFYSYYSGFLKWVCRVFIGFFALFIVTLVNSAGLGGILGKAKVLLNFSFLQNNYKTPILAHGFTAAFLGLLPFAFWTVYLCMLVYLICRAGKHPLLTLVLFLAAFATLVMMFFSPTIVASGQRTMFVCSVILGYILYDHLGQAGLFRRPIAAVVLAGAGLATMLPVIVQAATSR